MAAAHLFGVHEEFSPLSDMEAMALQKCVTKILFVTKRVRLNIQTTVALLTTGVRIPDEDYWKNLRRVLA